MVTAQDIADLPDICVDMPEDMQTALFGRIDMRVLDCGRREAPKMPSDMLASAWDMLTDFAEGSGAPVDYVAFSYLASCASLIGPKRQVVPFADAPQWSETPVLWLGCVGDPSSNKSPGIDAPTSPLRLIEADHAEAHKEALRQWEADKEGARLAENDWVSLVEQAVSDGRSPPVKPEKAMEPEQPTRRRCVVSDATPESAAVILAANPQGFLHNRDELAGWFQGFERYAPGGREFWIEAYGARPYVVDRKGSAEPLIIPYNAISVVGGIQPEKLSASLLAGPDDGLAQRFLFCWPESKGFKRPKRAGDSAKREAIYRRLDSLEWVLSEDGKRVPRRIPLDTDAADCFADWCVSNDSDGREGSALYSSFCGKLKGAALRLALICQLSEWAISGRDEPESVRLGVIRATLNFVDQYAKPMALRVYGDAALPQAERDASAIAKHIRKHRLTNFNAKQLRRASGFSGPKQPAAMDAALEVLTDAGWVRMVGERAGNNKGRAPKDYIINPRALEQ